MNKKPTNHRLGTFFIALLAFVPLFTSCVDIEPGEVLDYKHAYTDVDAADAAIRGLYGQFMSLADRVVVLNELRADLMDVTPYATTDLQEINVSRPSEKNVWADVTPFYQVIQSCNDILFNFNTMLNDNRMNKAEYSERYSDVAALRTWVYLQLGIHFGRVPYITAPTVTLSDLDKNNASELDLDALIVELISCMEALPTLENYKSSPLIQNNVDGYSLKPFFIDKRCLLADLYLYDNRYQEAATLYRQVLATDEELVAGNKDADRKYRIYCSTWTSSVSPDWYQILYQDGRGNDENGMTNFWREMFAGVAGSQRASWEHIWFFTYDNRYEPKFTLRKLFDPVSDKGNYYLKPSEYVVDELWGAEMQQNGFPFDVRGITGAYEKIGGENYIRKYSYFDVYPSGTAKGGWFLYRAAMLNLRYAEAANRAGYPKLAWAIVNNGLFGSMFDFKKADGSAYPGDSVKISGDSPFEPYPFPYNFDARYTDSPVRIRGAWRGHGGIRGRANLTNVNFPDNLATKDDSIHFVEKLIVHEAALELAFEGHRWEDLIRVARRMNKENAGSGDKFLWDENIAKKYKNSAVAADLSSNDKWFLPIYK
ncbi:MAG: RagB/SusD family nutrient uptake outer membrane protein [Prevotellaceae bacterium]|nr:RagB/SusD family nutrient uptake outer membrane protein [Prevotellaceae bacterium]